MGNPILWWVIGISEVVALALAVRVWRSDDMPVMKAMLTFVALIPVLGPFIVLWVTRFPNPAAPVLQNRASRGSGLYSLYWSRMTGAPSPIRRFRRWREEVARDDDA